MSKHYFLSLLLFVLVSCNTNQEISQTPIRISGIYPHLAFYNSQGECGTGAVVPWANRLWAITYSPHFPFGSDDKLYEITPDFQQIVREESLGGTPANRMIHRESNQLYIGPYAIDQKGNVRGISYEMMPGRHTGNARHLTDPENKIYYATMEEGFYEVDVHTNEVKMHYKDGHEEGKRIDDHVKDPSLGYSIIPGAHGKGLYSGQGVVVYSNNGATSPEAMYQFDVESGVLAEWNGENWKTVRRNQFVEVTGPGGIYGNANPETDPIWATGWDHKSIIVGVRSPEGWSFYRLPKASHSYDGAHGWNTEWPRIRDIGTPENPDYLMTMHGMFWRFPETFTAANSAGIRPRSAYLKVIGDFTRWEDELVMGCDDSAQKEFLNKRKLKGGIEGPGQSNSNLWFISLEKPDQLGPNTAAGSVWLNEDINVGEYSEPFLFAGWPKRTIWVLQEGPSTVDFVFEVDKNGTGQWTELKTVNVNNGEAQMIDFSQTEVGEWIRVKSSASTKATLSFNYTDEDDRATEADGIFAGIAPAENNEAIGGLLYGLGDNRRALGISANYFKDGKVESKGYYELDAALNLVSKEDVETEAFIQQKFAIPQNVLTIEESSVLAIDDDGRRWRFPLGNEAYNGLTNAAQLRLCREVATERDLFNCHGTFYELPAENADGFAKVRPIASHNFRIHDYASYRGLLVMTGINPNAQAGEHIIRSDDGNAAVWVGAIDDLWKLGKPRGRGGPWKESAIKAGEASDPYLIGFYDQKSLTISHNASEAVIFRIEVEPIGHGPWMLYKEVSVKPGETFEHIFSDSFQARWIRFVADRDCEGTAWLEYK